MFNLYGLNLHTKKLLLPAMIGFVTAIGIPLQSDAQTPCVCTNCPQFMPDWFTGNFYIQIQNAENPTLGQNGQGVCGVILYFDHEYIGDLQISLTSPAGQTVTLIGPIGLFGMTDFTTWNITFVPCGDVANPDPGFSPMWNNNQPWGMFGNYSGSYYPFSGCLENFNAGPVNGQWTLTVIDGQANDVGNFFNYEIIFCDPTGIDCFSCAADAGVIPTNNVTACEGDAALDLNLPPTYTPPAAPPPTPEYSYTYVISGPGGVIQGYDPEADLTSYPPGTYTVCGMSYYTADEGDIPPPNGSLTVAQLSAQLNSGSPPFCGKITSACASVTIKELPPDIEEFQTICAPQCYVFFNQTYCQSGTYVRNLTQNGCPYTATLHLTVVQPSFSTINETICAGDCSQTPGFEGACGQGTFTEIYTNAGGCDSTVTLVLTEMNVVANIAPPPQLTCNQPSIMLLGTGSTIGPGVTYLWTASNGGNIAGPANGINATVNAPGDYGLRVCRTIGNITCCDSTSVTVTGDQAIPATPAPINGPAVLCLGQTATYTVNTVANASSYNWTVPSGATINSGQGTTTINVTWTGNAGGNICVAAQNACGTSADTCLTIQISGVPVQATITGTDTICSGTIGNYAITPVAGATGYTWTVTANGVITSGQDSTAITVVWTGAPGGDVCVVAENGCGAGPQHCFPVAVFTQPEAEAGAGGTVCDSIFDLQATPVASASGIWTKVSGSGIATFSNAGSSSTSVSVSQYGTYVFQWSVSNGLCSDADSVTVQFLETPYTDSLTIVCDATNQNYTVSFPVSGGTAPYTVSGGTVTNGIFTSDPIPNQQFYLFTITDTNGCTSLPVGGSFNCNCTTNAGQMNLQTLTACEGDSVTAQHSGGETLDGDDVTAFVLHDNAGPALGTVFAQNNSGVFGFQNGMTYGTTYYVSFVAGNNLNGFPDPSDPCFSVAQGQPVVFFQNPPVDAGADIDTCGLTITLNGSPTSGMGQWTSSPGNLIFSDLQSPASMVTANAPGIFTLTWTVTENGCSGSDNIVIQFNEIPQLDDLQRICDAANENYTVTLTLSGGTQPYAVNGNVIAGAVFISSPVASGQSYSFTVTDANGCAIPPITGSFSCNCTTDAGTMQPDTLFACEGTAVTASANIIPPVLDGNDVTIYVLHDGAGPSLGQIFAQNTSGVFGLQNGMNFGQTYFISLIAGNNLNGSPDPADPCLSVASGQPVVFQQNPLPDAGPDNSTCGQTIDLQAVASNLPGLWSQVSGPGTATLLTPANPVCPVSVPVLGVYVFRWTETDGLCTGFDEVTVNFNETPSVTGLDELCDGANTQYTVTFTATGGTSPYTVTGLNGSFTGNAFTSDALASNSAYNFTVTDVNGCVSAAVSGVKNCGCITDAGTMSLAPAVFCANMQAAATWNNDTSLDADDVVQFILHDQAGASIGTIFATNSQPFFDFLPGLQTGVTYYISAIAGNGLAGIVDLNDPCLSVAAGAPVQWKPMPAANLAGDATVCSGETAILTFSGSGVFPLIVVYSAGGASQDSLIINSLQPVTIPVMPAITTSYTLVSVSDGSIPTCSVQLSNTATITVNQAVSAGKPHEAVELCAGVDLPLQLINFLTDADFGGQWTETSATPSLPGGFIAATGTFETSGQPAGTYTFSYLVTAQAPCPNDEATVTIVLLAPPVADAGEDQAINCDQAAVLLGGVNTSSGPGITYDWQLNGASTGSTAQIFVNAPGDYILNISNSAGCTSSDSVTVILDTDPPVAHSISIINIRCFGENNGSIIVDSVSTTHPPVLYALNGGIFSPNPAFTGLESGTYTITLLDANGCEWSSQPLTLMPPPELFIDLGAEVEAALGDSVYLKALTSVPFDGLDTIVWSPLLDTSAAGKDFQRFFPLQSMKVGVMVTDSNGCMAVDDVLIRVARTRHVYVPNIFNPQNGTLQVYGGRDVAEVEVFRIYDRWGEQLFEAQNFQANDPVAGWNGEQGGKEVSPGVYVYYAVVRFIDGETEIYTGDVTVFR